MSTATVAMSATLTVTVTATVFASAGRAWPLDQPSLILLRLSTCTCIASAINTREVPRVDDDRISKPLGPVTPSPIIHPSHSFPLPQP